MKVTIENDISNEFAMPLSEVPKKCLFDSPQTGFTYFKNGERIEDIVAIGFAKDGIFGIMQNICRTLEDWEKEIVTNVRPVKEIKFIVEE